MKFLALLLKEFLQFFRNRGLLIFAVYAFTLDIYLASTGIDLTLKRAPFFAEDRDLSRTSRELISKFPPYYFKFKGYILNDSETQKVLLNDQAVGVVVIPPHFEKRFLRGQEVKVGVIVNGAEISSSYLFSAYATKIITDFLTAGLVRELPFLPQVRIFFNQDASSKVFMAYSELLTVITLLLLLLPASAVVLEKERENIEMLLISPVNTSLFTVAKSVSMGALVLILTAFAITITIEKVAGVPFKGSLFDFLILTAAYAFTTTGLSLFIASVSENMLQVSQLTILLLIPILYLSGNWTPIEAMPKAFQLLSNLSPLKYYIKGALSIAIKGMSLSQIKEEFLKLTVLGGVLFGAGTYLLKRRG